MLETVAEWQNRPLEASYPLVFFDAMRVELRDEGMSLMAKVERAEAIVNRHAALLVRHGGRRPVITQQRGEGHNDS